MTHLLATAGLCYLIQSLSMHEAYWNGGNCPDRDLDWFCQCLALTQ